MSDVRVLQEEPMVCVVPSQPDIEVNVIDVAQQPGSKPEPKPTIRDHCYEVYQIGGACMGSSFGPLICTICISQCTHTPLLCGNILMGFSICGGVGVVIGFIGGVSTLALDYLFPIEKEESKNASSTLSSASVGEEVVIDSA